MKRKLLILIILIFLVFTGRAQILRPDSPEIDRVSIDTASDYPTIYWNASTSGDIDFFIMLYCITDIDGQWYPVASNDTVPAGTYQHTYDNLGIQTDSISLTLRAIDTSLRRSPFSDPHTTMHLTTTYDSCTKTMTLKWTPYIGWTAVARYEIYVRVDNGSYLKLQDVHGDSLMMNHHSIDENHRYCYFVKAIRPGKAGSFSNITCRDVWHALHPGYIDIEYASVDTSGGNRIDLAFYIDPSGEVNDFQLFRARPGTPYSELQLFTDISSSQFTYSDEVVGTDRRYMYMLYSLDVCHNTVTGSNVAGNIVLNARSVGLQSLLQWNPYEEYEAGIKNYHVYRITNQQEEELVRSLDPQDTTFTDDLGIVTGTTIQDRVCYYVVAEENDITTRGEKGFSRSNTVCISVVPEILMPNAFTPNNDGVNDEIKPVLTFIPDKYIYMVFDRWGSQVFETSDPQAGWNGRIRGNAMASEGVYIYYVKLTTASGIEVEQRGQVTVFYP